MNDTQNWRVENDAEDYFAHQKKATTLADRRPVIRKASDLVGPGIDAQAVLITDFNDLLATYNGYFSAEAGTFGAPNEDEAFVGTVVMDATLGGVQTFTGMGSGDDALGDTYTRRFRRNPADPASIFWDAWVNRSDSGAPAGTVTAFAGATAPDGWLVCNGASVSTTTYAALFAEIGYAFGGAGGSFNLPDTRDRAIYGVGTSWALGGTDGLAAGSRSKILDHDHGVLTSASGDHTHTTAAAGDHDHSLGSSDSNWVTDATAGMNVALMDHSHDVGLAGIHTHGATGTAGSHGHGGATWPGDYRDTAPALRGVGMNYIIKT